MMNHHYRELLLLHCVAALINVAINLLVLSVSHLKPGFQVCDPHQARGKVTRVNVKYL